MSLRGQKEKWLLSISDCVTDDKDLDVNQTDVYDKASEIISEIEDYVIDIKKTLESYEVADAMRELDDLLDRLY